MTHPTISVLIDTYNHARFIEKAVDSALAQTGVDPALIDILVVDDGSTDETPEILARYGDRIRLHRKPNGGQASAFNDAFAMSDGEIIAMLDGDDWWREDKLAKVLAAFAAWPDLAAVGHGIVLEDEVAGTSELLSPSIELMLRHARAEDTSLFHKNMCYLGTSRLTLRRAALAKIPPAPQSLIFEADEHFFTLLPAVGRVAVLPETLTHYRIHGGNLFQGSLTRQACIQKDRRKLEMRASVFACLAAELPSALTELGVMPDVIDALMMPVRLTSRRLKLITEGGSRWENVRSEFEGLFRPGEGWSVGKILISGPKLALALVLPPRSYFELRAAYSGSVLRRIRDSFEIETARKKA